ncbi:MFS transporter [Aromatoleum evansii]|uniref:MFS transporter n=1 Tax=Aromatoleum evansii TaxID=59406 RepID=A0ABZ1AE95_AROEV|nr:MFS transporter [Aromatoleum evansii]
MKTLILAIVLTAFIAVAYGFGVYLFSTVVLEMKRELSFGYDTVGIMAGVAQVGFLLCAFTGSLVSPIVGGARLALLSVSVCAVCLIGLGFVTNAWQAGVLLAILGGCAALVYVPLAEIVTRHAPSASSSKLLTFISSGTSYGVFANGMIVPLVVSGAGWRQVWLVTGGATMILALCSYFAFTHYQLLSDGKSTPKIDGGCSRYGVRWITPTVVKIWAISFLTGLTLLPFQTYLTPIIRDELNYPIATAGKIWASMGLFGMGSGFVVGALAHWIGIRSTLIWTLLSATAAAALIWTHVVLWNLYLSAALFGISFYPLLGLVAAYLSKFVQRENLTKTFGIANVLVGIGGVVGNFLGGLMQSIFGTFVINYASIAVLLLIASIVALFLRDDRHARLSRAYA